VKSSYSAPIVPCPYREYVWLFFKILPVARVVLAVQNAAPGSDIVSVHCVFIDLWLRRDPNEVDGLGRGR
jgi:hypothetical protein